MQASGGNENLLCIWDAAMTGSTTSAARTPLSPILGSQEVTPRFKMRDHVAAVKALAWCPWEPHTLVSG